MENNIVSDQDHKEYPCDYEDNPFLEYPKKCKCGRNVILFQTINRGFGLYDMFETCVCGLDKKEPRCLESNRSWMEKWDKIPHPNPSKGYILKRKEYKKELI